MSVLRTASLLLTLTCATLTYAGSKEVPPTVSPPNWGQVDMVDVWICPQDMVPTDMPPTVAITTTGGPVMMSFTVNVFSGNTTVFVLNPLIDHADIGAQVNWGSLYRDTLTIMRIVQLPAGVHTFGVKLSCQSSTTVERAWLTVYELPNMVR